MTNRRFAKSTLQTSFYDSHTWLLYLSPSGTGRAVGFADGRGMGIYGRALDWGNLTTMQNADQAATKAKENLGR